MLFVCVTKCKSVREVNKEVYKYLNILIRATKFKFFSFLCNIEEKYRFLFIKGNIK